MRPGLMKTMLQFMRGPAVCLIIFASGCGSVPVAQDLTQSQANEIVAALNGSGIAAQAAKDVGAGAKFRVEVDRKAYSQAISLMQQRGLPSEARITFSDLVSARGLLPGSRQMEALRVDRALAADLEEALQNSPDIIKAHVTVRLNSLNSGDAPQAVQPAVSVSLISAPGATIDKEAVARIAQAALPGISAEQIYVAQYPANDRNGGVMQTEGVLRGEGGRVLKIPLTTFLWFWQVPEDEYSSLALTFLSGFVFVFLLGGVVGFTLIKLRLTGALGKTGNDNSLQRTTAPAAQKRPKVSTNEGITEG